MGMKVNGGEKGFGTGDGGFVTADSTPFDVARKEFDLETEQEAVGDKSKPWTCPSNLWPWDYTVSD